VQPATYARTVTQCAVMMTSYRTTCDSLRLITD